MKTKAFYLNLLLKVLLLGIFSTLYLPNSFAQNYTQMSLPKGAKARLGKGNIEKMLYSPDGNVLAVVSAIGIWVYDAKTYQELVLIPARVDLYDGVTSGSIAFSVDGQMIIGETDYQTVYLWDVISGKLIHTHNKKEVSFSFDRRTLTIGSNNKTVQLWYGTEGNLNNPLKEKDEEISIMAFSPGGQTFATADETHIIRIWDSGTRKLKKRIRGHANFAYLNSVSLSPDGQTIASLDWGKPIQLWDVATGKLKKILTGYEVTGRHRRRVRSNISHGEIDSAVFSPDGQILASGSKEGTIRLWNVDTGKLKSRLTGHTGFIKCLSFSPNGKILASGCEDETIRLWNADTGKQKQNLPLPEQMNSISCLSFNRDGSTLVSGHTDGKIHLWDIATGNNKQSFLGHTDEISSVLFSSEGSTIASASWDGTVRLWDTGTGKQKHVLTGRKDRFYFWSALIFTSDGTPIAIRSDSEKMHLWDLINGQYMKSLIGHTSGIKNFPLSVDGRILATNSADGTVLVWDLNSVINTTDNEK